MNTILLKSIPNRCILDNLESNLYIGLFDGSIFRIPIKSIMNESNKMIDETVEEISFIGHK